MFHTVDLLKCPVCGTANDDDSMRIDSFTFMKRCSECGSMIRFEKSLYSEVGKGTTGDVVEPKHVVYSYVV